MRVRRRAVLDLGHAAGWYESQRTGLGAALTNEIGLLIQSLADNALLYPEVFGGVRRALARRLPYAIYFQLQAETVVVLRVLHMRQEPSLY